MWWNPFGGLGSVASKIVNDGWIAACLSVWQAGLWLLQLMLFVMDKLLTIDVSADGPGHDAYGVMLWIALILVTVIAAVQVGVAAIRRDGKGLARATAGVGGFVLAVAAWYGYAAALVTATAALTTHLAWSLLSVTTWAKWQPFAPFDLQQITDGWLATVLAFMGLLLWAAAIAHGLVLLTRNAALLVLIAVGPITAAGLPSESQLRNWWWKSVRWLHAAAFTPPLMVLVMGIGVKFASGVAVGMSSGVLDSLGTAVISVMLICISVVSPLALFKLLAFVDPGTSSGAAARAGLAAIGGIGGLLGSGGQSNSGGSASTSAAAGGASQGEAAADSSTASRIGSLGGPLGTAFGSGLDALTKVGSMGASALTDVTNQAGVGHNTYQPDYLSGGTSGSQGGSSRQPQKDGTDDSTASTENSATDGAGGGTGSPAVSSPSAGGGPAGGGAGGAGAAGGAGGAGSGSGGGAGGSAAGGAAGGGSAVEAVEVAALIV